MATIKYVFLGIIQGLTEFLPVSSSGHLVIFQNFLQIQRNQLILDIVLHLGTLAALVVFLFKDIKRLLSGRIVFYIFLAAASTVFVVILGQDFFEGLFSSAKNLVAPLLITGVILLGTKKFSQGKRTFANLKIADSIWLGLVQGFCVIPGLSRSGLTISTLLFRNVEKETAFKFSLLASIPAILGAFFFKINDFPSFSIAEIKYVFFGFVSAFLSGLLALRILLAVIRKARLHLFGYYCLALALGLWRWLR